MFERNYFVTRGNLLTKYGTKTLSQDLGNQNWIKFGGLELSQYSITWTRKEASRMAIARRNKGEQEACGAASAYHLWPMTA